MPCFANREKGNLRAEKQAEIGQQRKWKNRRKARKTTELQEYGKAGAEGSKGRLYKNGGFGIDSKYSIKQPFLKTS